MATLEELAPLLSGIDRAAQSILIQLCFRAKDGSIPASHSDLAEWTGIKATKTIKSATAELAAKGFVRIRPGQPGLSSIYEITLPGRTLPTKFSPVEEMDLTPEKRILLQAVKKGLSSSNWNEIKQEALLTGKPVDYLVVRKYFGPETVRLTPTDEKPSMSTQERAPSTIKHASNQPLTAKALDVILENLFVSSSEPVSFSRLAEILQLESTFELSELRASLERLKKEYEGRGLLFSEIAGGYQLTAHPAYVQWVKRLRSVVPVRITDEARVTLAIIAYKQPITRIKIEEIRGCDCESVLNSLQQYSLVRVAGVLSGAYLYCTTKHFLSIFNLMDLTQLPPFDPKN